MFKVKVQLVYDSGGYVGNPHSYIVGNGAAMNRSPKKAMRMAMEQAECMVERKADKECGPGGVFYYCPVLQFRKMWKGRTLILDDF